MSQALQRVVVRMLYDPSFVLAVYRDAAKATADVALTDEQRRWLTQPDRRAWTLDRQRRARSLAALIDEYPASTRAGEALDAFFSSTRFHQCIQAGGSLAVAYGVFLQDHYRSAAWLAALAKLESAVVQLRRRPPIQGPAGWWVVHRRVALIKGPHGLCDVYTRLMQGKGMSSAPVPSESETLLAELGDDGTVQLATSSPELATLLDAAGEPRPKSELIDTAVALGCSNAEAHQLLDELLVEGLLASCQTSG